MLQMASMMRGAGFDPVTGPFGGSTFASPGNPNSSRASNTASTTMTPGGGPASSGTAPAPNPSGLNPLGADPSALLQLLGAGASPLGGVPTPVDTRPPEERFQVQLQVRTFVIR
jgi:ubiquilin